MGSKAVPQQASKPHSSEGERWNAVSEGWHRWMPKMAEWYAPATEMMLDLVQIKPGDRVLDIAAGDGDQSLAAAARVGPSGYVLATDLAADLLAIAGQSAREAGFSNVEIRVMDGEHLDLPDGSFDAVICRFALMYFEDAVLGLQGMKRVLKPGGRLSVVVYGENGSPEFSLALSAARRSLGREVRPQPAATSLGSPGVLEQKFETAGFRDIELHSLTLPVRLASAAECVRYLQDSSPGLKELLQPYSAEAQMDAWQAMQAELVEFESGNGFEVQHRILVAAGSAA